MGACALSCEGSHRLLSIDVYLPPRFLYDGERITDDDTPSSLDMDDNGTSLTFFALLQRRADIIIRSPDTIDVMVERMTRIFSRGTNIADLVHPQRWEAPREARSLHRSPLSGVPLPYFCIIALSPSRSLPCRRTRSNIECILQSKSYSNFVRSSRLHVMVPLLTSAALTH